MIYYISLDNPNPSGGVKTQYRHVEVLNKAGQPASMLHQERPFTAATWFESTAPVKYLNEVEVSPGDIVVWPEILRASIYPMQGVKQVIFNQNVHYTWRGMKVYSKYEQDIDGTMVLTEYERSFISSYVPNHPISVVRHGIDPSIFAFDGRKKKKQIAFMPRKHRDEAEAVLGWLYQSNALTGWNIVEIDQKSEKESADILKDTAVFFAFGYPEGGTLPPFEAAAAGCNVIGYGGYASDALLRDAWGRVVPSGDTCAFANVARDIILYPEDLLIKPERMSNRALAMFPMQQEKKALLDFFGMLEGYQCLS